MTAGLMIGCSAIMGGAFISCILMMAIDRLTASQQDTTKQLQKLVQEKNPIVFYSCTDLNDIPRFVNQGVDINGADEFGHTALHLIGNVSFATTNEPDQKKDIERVRALIANGANPKLLNTKNEKPSQHCANYLKPIFQQAEAEWDKTHTAA